MVTLGALATLRPPTEQPLIVVFFLPDYFFLLCVTFWASLGLSPDDTAFVRCHWVNTVVQEWTEKERRTKSRGPDELCCCPTIGRNSRLFWPIPKRREETKTFETLPEISCSERIPVGPIHISLVADRREKPASKTLVKEYRIFSTPRDRCVRSYEPLGISGPTRQFSKTNEAKNNIRFKRKM
jgi:hypothetical protein